MHAHKHLSLAALGVSLVLAPLPTQARPSTSPTLLTRFKETADALADLGMGGKNVMERYGNWLGRGWWGGSELDNRVGMSPPVDDLDAVAQKHDFGYQLAEELGRGRPGVEGTYRLMADLIAIRDAMRLDSDPRRWTNPPRDAALASTFVKRLVIIFEEYQTRLNRLRAAEMGPTDITDLDTLNRVLDGLPDEAEFERMQYQRVRGWQSDYAAFQARKRATAAPAPAPSPTSRDCNQDSVLDRALCSHDPSKDRR